MLSLSLGYVALHGHGHAAYADDDDDSGGGDDGDSKEKGDGGDADADTDEPAEDDKDQPPVTAGGLYTLKTYPVRENSRPLTITEGIAQVRVGLGTDLSAKGAFGSFGASVEAIYGLKDNFQLIGGLTDAYNFKQFGVYFGFEAGLAYDLVDVRVAANLHRFALPVACGDTDHNPPTDVCSGVDPTLPSGKYLAAGAQFSIDLGFPFRYSLKPEIAIVALQTLMSIDFNGSQRGDPSKRATGKPLSCAALNASDATMSADPLNCVENGAKPDFNPSLGIATNPIPQLSVTIFAQLRIPDFDTSTGNFQVPVTGRVEFSPSQKIDIGLEFTLLNVKPPDPQSAIDNRYLSLFAQGRFGK